MPEVIIPATASVDSGGRVTAFTTPSLVYTTMLPMLQKMRDVYGGNKTMREAGKKYLPMLLKESEKAYRARLVALTIPNSLREAIRGYAGRIFAKPTTKGEGFDESFSSWWEDIDRLGSKADVFFRRVVLSGILNGISWVLVDMPASNAENLAQEREMNIRPYCRKYDALDVIFVEADEQGQIIDFRVRETAFQTVEMVQKQVTIVRRYTPGMCEIFNETTGLVTSYSLSYPAQYGVPVVPYVAADEVGSGYYVEPPMLDMADLSIRLWNSQAEQDNCLHIARCPILFARGWKPETNDGKGEMIVTTTQVYYSEDPAASLNWIEHSGAALGAGRDDIESLQRQIQAAGLKPLLNMGGDRTATEVDSDDMRASSPLRNMADNAQDMIENVLRCMARWIGRDDGPSVSLNSNFEITRYDGGAMSSLMDMRDNGMITKKTLLKEAQRRGLLSDDLNLEDELKAAEKEIPGNALLDLRGTDANGFPRTISTNGLPPGVSINAGPAKG